MLDALLKNKFYRKCKSAISLTKVRIERIKRKRNAMQKHLKNDVAELMKDGLDKNAYGRAEGLLVELNLTSCYDFTEKFCDHILENLSAMSKQRECPEDCQEAVSSLIFAAARFADLPELRHLRSIFTERYGNALGFYASKEFVEKFKLAHPTKEATLQLMQDIATEAGVHCDSKATEEKLYNPPPAFGQVRSNVTDKFQISERPKEDSKLSYISNHPKQRKSWKDIQEDIVTGSKVQETKPDATRNVPDEESDDEKTFKFNPVPPYTKSRIRNNRNKDEGQLRVDSNDGIIGVSERGSTTSIAKKDNSERGKKGKDPTLLDEDQPDEEERWLDRLLMFYSRKKTKLFNRTENTETTKVPPKQDDHFTTTRKGARWDFRAMRASLSLSAERDNESEGKNKAGHIRSTSLQPEMLKGGHVHPNLPDDYDDFLAHLAAIKNGGK